MEQGITVRPTPITAGEKVEIRYSGLLSQSGAQEIYLHAGFGNNGHWEEVKDIKMLKNGHEFYTTLEINTDKRFNFCFRDDAGNWDNNNGLNWSFEVHNGDL